MLQYIQLINTKNTAETAGVKTHCSKSLVWYKSLGGHIRRLAEGTSELIFTEVLLDALVAEALTAALDDDGILHQLLAQRTDKLSWDLKFDWSLWLHFSLGSHEGRAVSWITSFKITSCSLISAYMYIYAQQVYNVTY